MSALFLIAHVVNAQSEETAKIEFEIASEGFNDEWYTNDGRRVWPFWSIGLLALFDRAGYGPRWGEIIPPPIPPGWLDYLRDEAIRFATENAAPGKLDALLGLVAPIPTHGTFKRRF